MKVMTVSNCTENHAITENVISKMADDKIKCNEV